MDFVYLLLVFSCNEDSEFEIKFESDKLIFDIIMYSYEIMNRYELVDMVDNVYDYIYIEIIKDNIDNISIVVDSCEENKD